MKQGFETIDIRGTEVQGIPDEVIWQIVQNRCKACGNLETKPKGSNLSYINLIRLLSQFG